MENSSREVLLRLVNYHRNEENDDNENSEEGVNNRANQSRQILNYILTRVRDPGSDTEELSSVERRLRRRRGTYLDDEDNSDDEMFGVGDEEYLDFRTYPLTISWKDTYSADNDSCIYYIYLFTLSLDEILENYGYIAVYVYSLITQNLKNFKTRPDNFIIKIVEFYFKNFENFDDSKSAQENTFLIKKCFPSLKVIKMLLFSEYIVQKEVVFIKIVFDLMMHYYSSYEKNNHQAIINELAPTMLLFYSSLTNEDLKYLYKKLSEIKDTSLLLSKIYIC
jgi:hypothetical protein